MTKLFFVFALLQAADLATTVMTLKLGGVENNPLIQSFLTMGSVLGLVLAKIVVLLIAAGCAAWGRQRPLRCANAAFAGVVSWNLFVIARLLI
jgi:hypothetical protein